MLYEAPGSWYEVPDWVKQEHKGWDVPYGVDVCCTTLYANVARISTAAGARLE